MFIKDVEISDERRELLLSKHNLFLQHCAPEEGSLEQLMSEHLKMSGIYWTLTAYDLINGINDDEKLGKIIQFIGQCQHSCGGVSASVSHDPHLLYTLSAIQILIIIECIDDSPINLDTVVSFVVSLQQEDGSFIGDKWGEVDVRFSFCAIATLFLLGRLDAIDVDKAVEFIMKCRNQIDGGFGSRPGSESHAGLIYCALGALALTDQLERVDCDLLGWWLCERQLPSGGLNGRPAKMPDVCYSWWVLASLRILGKLNWIDRDRLMRFILACQDDETGGFADRPGDTPDPFHALFGIAAISLLTYEYENSAAAIETSGDSGIDFDDLKTKVKRINPVLCMTQDKIDRRNLHVKLL